MTPQQVQFLREKATAARSAGHLFPEMAACEAHVESWSTRYNRYTSLATQYHNLFGEKQHSRPVFATIELPTPEFLHGQWQTVTDKFIVFPSDEACFRTRMETLQRLAPTYPHYAEALRAQTPEEFVTEVSKTWSTGPDRAKVCIEVFHAHRDVLFAAASGSESGSETGNDSVPKRTATA